MELNTTGEMFIPGKFPKRLEDEHIERYKFAAQFVKDKRVLDIACGTGYGTLMLAQAGATHVDGGDLSEQTIDYARQHYQHPNVKFNVADATTFQTEQLYDVIVSFETIEHIPNPDAALQNYQTLLKSGGKLLISTPNRPMSYRPVRSIHDKPHNPYHVREFSLSEFLELLRRNQFTFRNEDIYGQRPHILITNRYLRKLYHMAFQPYDRSTPVVKPLQGLPPKYILVVATKPV